MQQHDGQSTKDFMLAMSYFLAGSFLVKSVISSQPSMNGFTLVVGIILIAAGFISALIALRLKHIMRLISKYQQRYGKYLYVLLFSITAIMIAATTLDFRDNIPLLVASSLFVVVILAAIVKDAVPVVFQNIPSILTFTIALIVMAIYLLFTVADKIQLVAVLVLCLVTLCVALYRVSKRPTTS